MSGTDSSNLYKCLLLFVMFVTSTYTIFTRYLIIFLYSVPTEGLDPDKARWESIKEAFNITSTQYGYIAGPIFTIIYCFFNLFSGYFADNFNRKYLMFIGVLLNVLSVSLMYFATHFWHLMALRAMLAAGQANLTAISYSLLNGYFTDNRTLANSIFASAVYSGYGLSTLTLLVLPVWGWAHTSLYIGYLGFAIAAMFLLIIREPKREVPINPVLTTSLLSSHDNDIPEEDYSVVSPIDDVLNVNKTPEITPSRLSWFESMWIVLKAPHIWIIITILSFRLSAGGVIGAFFPILMKTQFPLQKGEFATLNCIVVSTAGVLSGIIGGMICDKWVLASKKAQMAKHAENLLNNNEELPTVITPSLRPYLSLAGMSCMFCLPAFAYVFLADNLHFAMATLFLAYVLSECYFAPLLTFIHTTSQLPAATRSTGVAVSLALSQLLGSIAPVLVGMYDDRYNDLKLELLVGFLGPTAVAGAVAIIAAIMIK